MQLLLEHEHSFINGKSYQTDDTFSVLNPANLGVVKEVSSVDELGCELALSGAQCALKQLRTVSASLRSEVLKKWHALILSHEEMLAELMVAEQGKPLHEALGEVRYAAGFVEWFAQEAIRSYGETIPSQNTSVQLSTIKQPVGVVLGITPWNFPLAMITRKVAPAYAAGCSFILKPSEETPLSAIALAKLAIQAGMEAGAFQVLITRQPAKLVEGYCQSAAVRKLTFTGSTKVGQLLLSHSATTIKRTSMELGGNAPFIVYGSANIPAAVAGLMAAKFRNAGQTCVAANRVLVEQECMAEFISCLTTAVATLKVGDGMVAGNDLGPLINESAKAKVQGLIASALKQGAKIHYQGAEEAGLFMAPVILTHVTPEMDIANTEIFGPIVSVMAFFDEVQSLVFANGVEEGLAAYFYSQDVSQIHRVSHALEYGMIGINEGMISNPVAPFGGIKQSGLGREGAKQGLDEYLEVKYLCQKFD
ncbi:succinate-semialdehyde dehydrogenase / glutarate-semialdehyde dehydrogenase [Pseudoalteromonas citrea]|uniref:Succinate-semialdehyde dehydrogenase / glutarate-semialdehyde dehydrogenase n=2 Tax=Pseudoalteromonas citrea TaxID=43655 RepID=A0AAD4AJK0_9GAMM|nr:NAD-dependent succinate-semialdehyde dehydrogenase [Pseudoalteromonas citrea]KAF7772278.1 succinate-semialdehyde dehydrogenase / glutarate-semialdehyde dehydrogenase [Pseudoalteromonas citrea]